MRRSPRLYDDGGAQQVQHGRLSPARGVGQPPDRGRGEQVEGAEEELESENAPAGRRDPEEGRLGERRVDGPEPRMVDAMPVGVVHTVEPRIARRVAVGVDDRLLHAAVPLVPVEAVSY